MLHLSNDLKNALMSAKPKASVPFKGKTLCLYLGEMSRQLRESGLLNIILWDSDRASGLGVTELESSPVTVKFQEQMTKLNSSEIVSLSLDDGRIYLQHWDGFRTEMDIRNMDIVSQKFTK